MTEDSEFLRLRHDWRLPFWSHGCHGFFQTWPIENAVIPIPYSQFGWVFRSLTITQFSLQQNLGSSAKVWCKGSLVPSMVEFGCCNHFRPSGDKKEIGSLVGTLSLKHPWNLPISADCLSNPSCHCCFVTRPQKNPNPSEKKKKKNPVQPVFWGTLKPIMGLELLGSPCGAAGGTGTREDLGSQYGWNLTWHAQTHGKFLGWNWNASGEKNSTFGWKKNGVLGWKINVGRTFCLGEKNIDLGNQLRSRHGQKCALAAVMLRSHRAWLPRKMGTQVCGFSPTNPFEKYATVKLDPKIPRDRVGLNIF